MKYAHFITSCLYTWEANKELDQGIVSNGMLIRPLHGLLYAIADRHSTVTSFASCRGVNQPHLARWRINEELSFGHLVTITALANTIVSLPALSNEQRQYWSHLLTQHCVMLNDQVNGLINPRVEALARRWSDRLVEIREAVQSLLLDRLRRLDQNGKYLV